jgi:hypothetical protein
MNAFSKILASTRPKASPQPIRQQPEPDPRLSVSAFLQNVPQRRVTVQIADAPRPAPPPVQVEFPPVAQPCSQSTSPQSLNSTFRTAQSFRHQLRIQENGIVDLEESRLFYRGTYLHGRQSVPGKGGRPVDMIVDIPSEVAVGEFVAGLARSADCSRGRMLERIEGQVRLNSQGHKIFVGHIYIDTATTSSSGCTIKKYALQMTLRTSSLSGTRWLAKRSGTYPAIEASLQTGRC